MIPMFQAKEEELQAQHCKLKGLREEIQGYMEETGMGKVRYAQPQHYTHFMNRPRMALKKASTSVMPTNQATDVTNEDEMENPNLNADLELEKMQNSAIFTGQVTEETPRDKSIQQPEMTKSSSKKPADYEHAYREFEKKAEADGNYPNSLDQHCYISEQEESDESVRGVTATLGSSRQVGTVKPHNRSAATTGMKWN